MIEAVFFYVFSTVLVLSAMMVISARNPVHSVLFLILAFFNAAGLFVMLGAEFIAMIMVIVYVGAVAVLFLFVVMMLDINFAELRKGMMRHAPVGGLVGLALLAEFTFMYLSWSPSSQAINAAEQPIPDQAAISNTHALGEVIYTHYAYLFQISGLILLVAMVGAITLTLRRRPDSRRQNVANQNSRRPEDVLKVEKITSGTGVS
jgi:NADH-quinone oxidoreductase subunit J